MGKKGRQFWKFFSCSINLHRYMFIHTLSSLARSITIKMKIKQMPFKVFFFHILFHYNGNSGLALLQYLFQYAITMYDCNFQVSEATLFLNACMNITKIIKLIFMFYSYLQPIKTFSIWTFTK